jgi:hypothetical protein
MLDQRIAPNQYIDRNGNVRTRAIRHSLAAAERRAAANVVPAPTLEQRRAAAIAAIVRGERP